MFKDLNDLPPVLTIKEAADIARCSPWTIRRALRLGLLKGGRTETSGASPHRIKREHLLAWLFGDEQQQQSIV